MSKVLKPFGEVALRPPEAAAPEPPSDYQVVFENANEGIFIHDCESGAILKVNQKAAQMTGFTTAELCRLTVGDISGRDEAYSAASALRKIHTAVREGPIIFEWVFRYPNGHEYPVEVNLKSIEIDGQTRILALVRDITKRKAAENELVRRESYYRKLIENASDGIAILGPDGEIRYLGPSTHKVLGYHERLATGRNAFDFLDPKDARRIRKLFRELKHGDETVRPLSYRIRHRDGTWRAHEGSYKNLQHDPNVQGILVNFRDVTERLQAEAIAQQRERQLQHMMRLSTMGEMATAIAHELNQPFASVVNYLGGCIQRLRSGRSSREEILAALEAAQSQAEHAGKVIHTLRSFLGRSSYQRTVADINELIEGISPFIEIRAEDAGVTVKYGSSDSPVPAVCDHILIEQVILNLAINGIEAMAGPRSNGRMLTIRTEPPADGVVRVSVEDQGPGLQGLDQEKLFDAFFTTKAEGLGIGLSLCRSIVDSHDGRLWCESDPDRGTTFHFTLPAGTRS